MKQYNKFLERKAPRGYKYQLRENGDVFVIDMSNTERSSLVVFLTTLFNIHNAIDVGTDVDLHCQLVIKWFFSSAFLCSVNLAIH